MAKVMTPAEGQELLLSLIKRNEPHKEHKETVEDSDFWKSIVTGEEQDELIVSYKLRESDEQKQQRIHITNTPTPKVTNRILSNLDRLDNPDGLIRQIGYDKADTKRMDDLMNRVAKFNGDRSMDSYVDDEFKRLNIMDANAFLVVLFDVKRMGNGVGSPMAEKPRPRPEIVPAKQVYDKGRDNGEYIWLCRREKRHKEVETGMRKNTVEYSIFTLYFTDYVIQAQQINEANTPAQIAERDGTNYVTQAVSIDRKELQYAVFVHQTQSGEVPFINWGYQPDEDDDTYLSILEPVRSDMKDLVNRGSEYALTMALHTFLQKYQYTRKCVNRVHKEGVCDGGKLSISQRQCPVCAGTGKEIMTTVQDTITVALPDTKDEFFPLSEMVRYVEMPFEIVNHLRKELDTIPNDMENTLWGLNQQSNDTFGDNITATEIITRYDTAYARLSKMAEHKEMIWAKCLRLTARYAEIEEGLTYKYKYPRTYQMETITELMTLLRTAKTSGAPLPTIQAIEQAILRRQGQVSDNEIRWYNAMDAFRPFKSKSESDIAGILAGLPETSYYKILWTYFDEIFEQIKTETPGFVVMPKSGQGENTQNAVVKAAVEAFREIIAAEMPTAVPSPDIFNRNPVVAN